jgi:hypothetical protein
MTGAGSTRKEAATPKLPIPRIPSDDFEMKSPEDGEWYAVHAGEWVEMLPRRTFAEIKEYQRFSQLSADLVALQPAEGDLTPEAVTSRTEMRAVQQAAFTELCEFLADRVVRWTWTGPTGRPLVPWNDEYQDAEGQTLPCARLDGDPKVIERLDAAEIYYLLNVEQGETPADRKNGSAASPTTTSDSLPPATAEKPSTSDRSLTKAR